MAIADVDAAVRKGSAIDGHARTNTTSVYTAAQIFPMLPEKLSTDLTSLRRRTKTAWRSSSRWWSAPDGTVKTSAVYRAMVLNRAKLAYNGVAAWLDGKAPPPRTLAAVRRARRAASRSKIGVAQAMNECGTQHGALSLETIQARAVFNGDVLADLLPDEKNRAKELIEDFMIAANGVTAKYLEGKGVAVAAPDSAHARALGSHRRARGRRSASACRLQAETRRAGRVPDQAPAALTRRAFPTFRSRSSSCWARANMRSSVPGQPIRRALRAGRQRLHPLHRAQPALSRSHHATPAQGRRSPTSRRRIATRSSTRWRATAPSRKTMRRRWNGRSGSLPRRCSWPRGSVRGSTPS